MNECNMYIRSMVFNKALFLNWSTDVSVANMQSKCLHVLDHRRSCGVTWNSVYQRFKIREWKTWLPNSCHERYSPVRKKVQIVKRLLIFISKRTLMLKTRFVCNNKIGSEWFCYYLQMFFSKNKIHFFALLKLLIKMTNLASFCF